MTKNLGAGVLLACLTIGSAHGATLIIADDYNVVNSGSGWATLGSGVNSGINPPTQTRLTGSTAANLRYMRVDGTRGAGTFYITNNPVGSSAGKLAIGFGTAGGSLSLSNNAGGIMDFGPALFSTAATPSLPSKYEIRIDVGNYGSNRVSFGIGSAIGNPGVYDFGFQLERTLPATSVSLYKRIDALSAGNLAGTDLNSLIAADIAPAGTDVQFLIRVTDAGAQSGSEYNSQIQLGIIGATSTNWIYDTSLDSEMPFGWRFRGENRYIFWQAEGSGGPLNADNFSLTWLEGPTRSPIVQTWTGAGGNDNWSTAANWNGVPVASGDALVFGAAVRQNNNNDLSSLTVPSLTLTTGGFQLGGNELKVFGAVTNTGNNTIALPLTWTTSGAKTWDLAAANEFNLNGGVTVDVGGDHTMLGGGTFKLNSTFQVGQNSTVTPAFLLADGRFVMDGAISQYRSTAGFRIGANGSTNPSVAELVISNGASFNLTASGAGCRVGSIANGLTNRLIIDNSSFIGSGGEMGIPWVTGGTGEVTQVGGLVSDLNLNFNRDGGGRGVYTVKNGTLEPRSIQKLNSGGFTAIYFDGATLRPSMASTSVNFMVALDVAEIRSGGLTLDVPTMDIALAAAFSGSGSLIKSGNYAAALTGQNTYAGNTIVQAGKLLLSTTQTNSAAVQVSDGAQFGAIVTAQGSSLTVNSLSLAGSSGTLAFDLGAFPTPTAPLAQVGTFSANGTITVNVSGGALDMTTGTFTLLKWNNRTGTSSFQLGTLPSHIVGHLVSDSDSVDLVVTGVQGYRWAGNQGTDWFAAGQNWIDMFNNTPASYQDGFLTEFRDGAATGIVNVNGTASPLLMLVNNELLPYTFDSGAIVTSVLRKEGPGTATRSNGASDQIGKIQVNQGSFIASDTFPVTEIEVNGGTFVANTTVDASMVSPLTDASAGLGTFKKDGAGILTAAATNSTYDGAVVIQAGTLRLAPNTVALGTTNGGTTVLSGASLDVANVQAPHEPVTVSGAGVNGQGAVVNNTAGGGVQNNLTDVTMVGDTVFGCVAGSRWDIRIRSSTGVGLGLRGNGYNMTKVGGGTLSISSQRHNYGTGVEVPYWRMNLGDVVIKEGSLAFEESISLDNPEKQLVLFPGTTMNLFSMGITNPIVRNLTITNANLTCGGPGATNVINGNLLLNGLVGIRVNGAYYVFNGNMSGDASLEIGMFSGNAGYIFLNGASTITGDTTVTNSTLAGGGSISGNLVFTMDGKFAPGDGIGNFNVGGNVTMAPTTVTTMELSPGQTPNCDKLTAGGAINAAGTLNVVMAQGASAPQAGDVFQIFSKGIAGSFAATNLPALSAGMTWNTDSLATDGSIRVASSQPPSINSASVTGGVFTFSGVGGNEGGTYYVVTSPIISAPMSTWVPIATNQFGPGGVFSFSTNVTAAPEAFFRLRVP